MMTWFSVQHSGDTAHVHIGDAIGCFAAGAEDLLNEIGPAKDVRLTICSSGGDSICAIQIFDALRGRCSSALIRRACSAGVIIAMAAERIEVLADAQIMVHRPSLACFSDAAGLRRSADELDLLTSRWLDILSKRTRAPAETVRAWLTGPDDAWFSAQEAVEAGLCDSIYHPPVLRGADLDAGGRETITAGSVSQNLEPDDESEKLLLDCLRAIGRVKSANKAKLFRELTVWFRQSIE